MPGMDPLETPVRNGDSHRSDPAIGHAAGVLAGDPVTRLIILHRSAAATLFFSTTLFGSTVSSFRRCATSGVMPSW